VPPEVILVSESGVKTEADVEMLAGFGVDAILIGTSIMESEKISNKVSELVTTGKSSRIKRR
ncbi:MAG TPA: indole-3-glycerol-phosphate synthase, partial [Methanobacterium sp.]